MLWIRRILRGKKVFVRATPSAEPAVASDGRVEVKYSARPDAKIYRASTRNLAPTGDPEDDKLIRLAEPSPEVLAAAASEGSGSGARKKSSRQAAAAKPVKIPDDAIVVYTDGACTGNPGPAGIGVVIIDGDERRELSEYLGTGTNNIAELTAILRALEVVADQSERPVFVHTDSAYSLGLLTKNWKAKANTELVEELRALARTFPALELVKVKGHAGIPENERADELARDAVSRRR